MQGLTAEFWRGRSVLVTGHTGFKGGWLAYWLGMLGARVYGYALAPPTTPNFFTAVDLEPGLAGSWLGDIRDLAALQEALALAQPEVVLHLAAQPLVRASYSLPVETFATNVQGTVHVLEAARQVGSVRAVVVITTDKCYANQEWPWAYREVDQLGGYDPYSASKACAELATAAYRQALLAEAGIAVATARAGNVIGGGDWAPDRLVPDVLRALDAGEVLQVRSPGATRPWQHVLEPLSGYLLLAERLLSCGADYAEAWNFGPVEEDNTTVAWIVERLCRAPGQWEIAEAATLHEAGQLRLDSAKARARLGWRPHWRLEMALAQTLAWHEAWRSGAALAAVTQEQIRSYMQS